MATDEITRRKHGAGSVTEDRLGDGTRVWRARVRIRQGDGTTRRESLAFREDEGWTQERAENEAAYLAAAGRRGEQIKRKAPAAARPVRDAGMPTFHVFASEWFERHRHEWSAPTATLRHGLLTIHLLPALASLPLSEIDEEVVDGLKAAKLARNVELAAALEAGRPVTYVDTIKRVREAKPLSPRLINLALELLSSILEEAVRYHVIPANPARGMKKVRAASDAVPFLEPHHVEALLAAARTLDEDRKGRGLPVREALTAALVLGGYRIDSEALELRRRDVDTESWQIHGGAKTAAGRSRIVQAGPMLQKILGELLATGGAPDALLFATSSGAKMGESNYRRRILAPAIERANAALGEEGRALIPNGITPHKLRATFISLLLRGGHDLPYVMGQAGHRDPRVTLGIYAHVQQRGTAQRDIAWRLVGKPDTH